MALWTRKLCEDPQFETTPFKREEELTRARVISSPGSFWLLTADKERERVKTSSVGRNCWPVFGLWHIIEVRWQSQITSDHLLSFGALACADLFACCCFSCFFFLAIHRGRWLWMKDETFRGTDFQSFARSIFNSAASRRCFLAAFLLQNNLQKIWSSPKYFLYMLAKNPEKQKILRQEVLSV